MVHFVLFVTLILSSYHFYFFHFLLSLRFPSHHLFDLRFYGFSHGIRFFVLYVRNVHFSSKSHLLRLPVNYTLGKKNLTYYIHSIIDLTEAS